MTLEEIKKANRDAETYFVSLIREYAKEVTGENFTFAIDDLHTMAVLAYRACKAGLTEGMDEGVRKKIAEIHAPQPPDLHEGAE